MTFLNMTRGGCIRQCWGTRSIPRGGTSAGVPETPSSITARLARLLPLGGWTVMSPKRRSGSVFCLLADASGESAPLGFSWGSSARPENRGWSGFGYRWSDSCPRNSSGGGIVLRRHKGGPYYHSGCGRKSRSGCWALRQALAAALFGLTEREIMRQLWLFALGDEAKGLL
jgi:hypothetical protein